MKAISKLISVVLILALCLSIFTVSAFAEEKPVVVIGDTLDLTDDNTEKTDPIISVDSENPPAFGAGGMEKSRGRAYSRGS